MYALEHDEILRRVSGLADKDPNASVYCVDAVGARFVDIPTDVAQWFSWTVSADSPLDLMAPNFRLAGSTLFRMCRQDGSAIGIVRMADRPNEDVELHLFNAGDYVTGVIVDIQSQRPTPSRDLPQSNVDTQRNAVITAGAAAAAATPEAAAGPASARDRWQAWETRTQDRHSSPSPPPAPPSRPAPSATERPPDPTPQQGPRTMRVHTDAAGVIAWVDDDAVEGLRRDRDTLIGSRLADYVHRDDKVVASMEWGDLLSNPHAQRSFRAQYLRGDGTTVVLDRTDTNRLDSDDRIIEVELVESAESVSDSQREFQSKLLSAVSADPSSAVAFVNSERKVSFANSEWTRVAWLAQGSSISGIDDKLVDPGDFRTAIDRALRNDRRSTANLLLRTAPDGGRFSANADVSPLRGPDGQHGALVTLTKIAEINAAEVAIRDEEQRDNRRPPAPTPPREERKDRSVAIAGAGVAAAGVAASQAPPVQDAKRSGNAWSRFRSDGDKKVPVATDVAPATTAVQPAVQPYADATVDDDRDRVRNWWTAPKLGLAAALVTALAAFLRFWDLAQLPPGMSGLEAISALEADRVLVKPSLYSTLGFGQPLGPMYVLGLVMRVFGDSLFVMRSVSAVVGIVTVLAFFWFARRYGGWAATSGAAVLAAMVWHLHFSRIALGVIWWPLVIVLFLWVIAAVFDKPITDAERVAIDRDKDRDGNESFQAYPVPGEDPETATKSPRSMMWRWIVGGMLLGLGVYIANTHWLLLAVIPIMVLPWAAFAPRVRRRGGFVGWLAMTLAAGLVAAPMGWRITSDGGKVLDTFSDVDARGNDWSSLSFMTQIQEIARWWAIAWGDLLGGHTDMTDGLGSVAAVHVSILIAAAIGLLVVLFRYQNGTTWILVTILLVAPFGSGLTDDSIGLRPSVAMAPVLALLAGVAVGWIADRFGGGSTGKGFGRAALVALPLTALMVGFSIDDYFWRFRDHPDTTTVYSEASDEAMTIIRDEQSFVNFYSAQQRWDGPRRSWQAPGAEGIDRSEEFGGPYTAKPTPNESPQLFVLLDEYADDEHIKDVLSENEEATITDGSVKDGYVVIKLGDPG